MRLWIDTKRGIQVKATIKQQADDIKKEISSQMLSRGVRAVNCIRNAELNVLKGQRTGRKYRKPYTKKSTYVASAPGEAPARRTGNLRLHWSGEVDSKTNVNGTVHMTAQLKSEERYSSFLENGTPKMAPRPFVDQIVEKAVPEIEKIFGEPY